MDLNILDRQTRTYGTDATNKLINSVVNIINPKSSDLLFEILKNLLLSGINKINICDIVDESKLNINNNFKLGNLSNSRIKIIVSKVKELNYQSQINIYQRTNISDLNICHSIINVIIIFDNNINFIKMAEEQNKSIIRVLYNNGNVLIDTILKDHKVIDIDGENYDTLLLNDYDYDSTTMHHVGIYIMKIGLALFSL
jgi:hypothetical protein